MKTLITNSTALLFPLFLLIVSCTKDVAGPSTDRAPMVNAGINRTVGENQLLSFTVTASDPDGDGVTLSALNLPTGAAFVPATGAFTWTPSDSQAGTYPLYFLGVASSLSDSDTVTVTVSNFIPIQSTLQAMVDLRSDTSFAILAGALISNIPTSAITGEIGLSPAARSYITGFGLTEVTGTIFAADDVAPAGVPAMLTAAKGDLTTAYNDAAGRTSTDLVLLAGNLGGLTLTPGLYKSSGSLEISSGDLTFDARGDANAVFIVQIASTLNLTSGRQVILSGGAKAANIFWQVGTSATLGTTSVFKGNIMADQSISLDTGAAVEGRLLARIGEITLDGNTVVKPAP